LDQLPPQEANLLYASQGPCVLPEAVPFTKGQELYREKSVALLQQGSAIVYRLDESGARLVIRSLYAGDLFGAASVFGDWKKGASSVLAKGEGKVLYLPEELFTQILKSCPTVALRYIRYQSDRIRFLNRRMDAFAAGSTQQRLYEFLTAQADQDGVCYVADNMAQLARMLHVGRTSLYRDLAALEQRELIIRDGKKVILNR